MTKLTRWWVWNLQCGMEGVLPWECTALPVLHLCPRSWSVLQKLRERGPGDEPYSSFSGSTRSLSLKVPEESYHFHLVIGRECAQGCNPVPEAMGECREGPVSALRCSLHHGILTSPAAFNLEKCLRQKRGFLSLLTVSSNLLENFCNVSI